MNDPFVGKPKLQDGCKILLSVNVTLKFPGKGLSERLIFLLSKEHTSKTGVIRVQVPTLKTYFLGVVTEGIFHFFCRFVACGIASSKLCAAAARLRKLCSPHAQCPIEQDDCWATEDRD